MSMDKQLRKAIAEELDQIARLRARAEEASRLDLLEIRENAIADIDRRQKLIASMQRR